MVDSTRGDPRERPAAILARGPLSARTTPAIMEVLHHDGPRELPRRGPPTGCQPARWSRSGGARCDDEGGSGAAFSMAPNRTENRMSFLTRRTFLQAALAAAASLFLPRVLFAGRNRRSFWFLHTATGQ